jgi:hypothetical protein
MKKLGILPGLIISKTVLLGAIAFAIHYDPNAYPMGAYLLGAVIAFYLVILVNNFSVLKELKKNHRVGCLAYDNLYLTSFFSFLYVKKIIDNINI